MKKILLIYLFLNLCIFSKEYTKKELVELIEKNKNFECNPTRKKFKVVGENMTGYVDEDDKPYGEWKNTDESIRECFLDDVRIQYIKDDYFLKRTEKFTLIIIDKKSKNEKIISLFIENEKEIYYFKYKNGRYSQIKKKGYGFVLRLVTSLSDSYIYKYKKIE